MAAPAAQCVRPTPLNRISYYLKTASTAYAYRDVMASKATANDTVAGYMIALTSTTERVLGVIQQKVVAADSDYASNTRKPVMIDEPAEWEFLVAGTAAVANSEQAYHDFTNSTSVNVGGTSINIVFVTRFISSTKVRGIITSWNSIGIGDLT